MSGSTEQPVVNTGGGALGKRIGKGSHWLIMEQLSNELTGCVFDGEAVWLVEIGTWALIEGAGSVNS